MLKRVKVYNLSYLITYLIIRCKVYIGEYQRKITEEFSIIEIKANHYVFIKEGRIIGLARILYYQDLVAELGRITIVREHRNQGYGEEMMRQIISKVYSSQKAEIIRLFLANKSLANFYQKFSFFENGEAYFNDVPYISMIKIL
jgi:predicted GNAT family N-acyltransferase